MILRFYCKIRVWRLTFRVRRQDRDEGITTKSLVPLGVLWLAILAAGCTVRSLQPLYTEGELMFEPALLGTWKDKDPKDYWTIRRSGERAYEIAASDTPDQKLEGRLVRVGGRQFLDLVSKDADEAFAVPAHVFVQVRLEGDMLHVALMEPDWLRDTLAKTPAAVAHVRLPDGDVVLSASPKQLQQFVLRHAADPKAFSWSELRR